MTKTNLSQAVGRRKTAVARVYLRAGDGKVQVNGRAFEDYFPLLEQRSRVLSPLSSLSVSGQHDLLINVRGGGVNGQVDAVMLGVARALCELDEKNRAVLKPKGYLRRDPRMVERKKYGRRGARRSFQFSKR